MSRPTSPTRNDLLSAWQQVEDATTDLVASFRDTLPSLAYLEKCLSRGARVDQVPMEGWERILDKDDVSLLERMLAADMVDDEEGNYALFARACELHASQCVELFLRQPAIVNQMQRDACVLDKAIRADYTQIVRQIFQASSLVPSAQCRLAWDGTLAGVKSEGMFELLHSAGAQLTFQDISNEALFFPRPALLVAMVAKNPPLVKAWAACEAWESLLEKGESMAQNDARLACAKVLRRLVHAPLAGPCFLASWPILLAAGFPPEEVERQARQHVKDGRPWARMDKLVAGLPRAEQDKPYDVATHLLCQAADLGLDITALWESHPHPELARAFARAGANVAEGTPGVHPWDICDGQVVAMERATQAVPNRPSRRL